LCTISLEFITVAKQSKSLVSVSTHPIPQSKLTHPVVYTRRIPKINYTHSTLSVLNIVERNGMKVEGTLIKQHQKLKYRKYSVIKWTVVKDFA